VPGLNDGERTVYEGLASEPAHTDEIVAGTGLSAGQVTAALVSLQLKGLVRGLPGNLFVKRTLAIKD